MNGYMDYNLKEYLTVLLLDMLKEADKNTSDESFKKDEELYERWLFIYDNTNAALEALNKVHTIH